MIRKFISIKISIFSTFIAEIKRKLYRRGSSFELTVPMPLLFSVDKTKKNEVVFKFDEAKKKWFLEVEPAEETEEEA